MELPCQHIKTEPEAERERERERVWEREWISEDRRLAKRDREGRMRRVTYIYIEKESGREREIDNYLNNKTSREEKCIVKCVSVTCCERLLRTRDIHKKLQEAEVSK